FFFFSSRRRHTRFSRDWSSDVCSSDLSGGLSLRKTLVVVQFAISVVLIVGTLVVYQQLEFMKSQDLGFQKDQIVVFDFQGDPIRSEERRVGKELISSVTT